MTNEAPSKRAILLTNNPRRMEFDVDQLAEWIEATAAGHRVEGRWSTGSTTRKIKSGDRAFLMRQGVARRGIFASGHFISSVFQGPHWDESDRMANYADVEWDIVIDPDDALPVDLLLVELPESHWEPQASGSEIRPAVVERLEKFWAEHVSSVRNATSPARTGAGQGRLLDTKLRKEIEDLAQRRLMERYAEDGWLVTDHHIGNPYDAIAVKGGQRLYLEAKGTVTSGERVIVTRNEVAWAREHPTECVIGILSGIALNGENGPLDEQSGTMRVYRWEALEEDLAPVQYDYYPAPEDGVP